MGLRAGLDGCVKSRPHRDSVPGPPARSKSLYLVHNACVVFPPTQVFILQQDTSIEHVEVCVQLQGDPSFFRWLIRKTLPCVRGNTVLNERTEKYVCLVREGVLS